MSSSKFAGGCQCGAIRYEITGDPVMTAICHCSMCRRAHAAPAVAWVTLNESQISFIQGTVTTYASSPEAKRGFCATCGTQISFTADYIPGIMDIAVGSFDTPEMVSPSLHYWDSQRLSWMIVADDLPRFPEFPPVE